MSMQRNDTLLDRIRGSLGKMAAYEVTPNGAGSHSYRDLGGGQRRVVLGGRPTLGRAATPSRWDVDLARESMAHSRAMRDGSWLSPGFARRVTEAGRSRESAQAMFDGTARRYGVSPKTQAQVRQYGQYGMSPDMQRRLMRNPAMLEQFNKATDISGTATGKRLAELRKRRAAARSGSAAGASSPTTPAQAAQSTAVTARPNAAPAVASQAASVRAGAVPGSVAPSAGTARAAVPASAAGRPFSRPELSAKGLTAGSAGKLTPYEQYQKGLITHRELGRLSRSRNGAGLGQQQAMPAGGSGQVSALPNVGGRMTVADMQRMAPGQPAAAYANATDYSKWTSSQAKPQVSAAQTPKPSTAVNPAMAAGNATSPSAPASGPGIGKRPSAYGSGDMSWMASGPQPPATPAASPQPATAVPAAHPQGGKPLLGRQPSPAGGGQTALSGGSGNTGALTSGGDMSWMASGAQPPSANAASAWKPAGSKAVTPSNPAGPAQPGQKPSLSLSASRNGLTANGNRNAFSTSPKNQLSVDSLSYGKQNKLAEMLRKSAGFVHPKTNLARTLSNSTAPAYDGPVNANEPAYGVANRGYYPRPETRARLARQQRRNLERKWYENQKQYVKLKSDEDIARDVSGYRPLADRQYGRLLNSFGASRPEIADYIHDSVNTLEMGANGMQKGLDWVLSKGRKWLDPGSWGGSISARINRMKHDTAWKNAARIYDARHEKLLGSMINADPNDKWTRRMYQLAKANGELAGGEIATAGLGKVLRGVGAGARLTGKAVGHVPGNIVASRIARGLSEAENAALYRRYADLAGKMAGRGGVPGQLRSFDAFKKAYGRRMVFGNDAVRRRWASLAGHGAGFKPSVGARMAGATGHMGESFGSAMGAPARYVGTVLDSAARGFPVQALRHPLRTAGRNARWAWNNKMRALGKGIDAEWRLNNAYDVARGAYTGDYGNVATSAGNMAWYDVMGRSRNPWVSWGLGMGLPVAVGMASGAGDEYTE